MIPFCRFIENDVSYEVKYPTDIDRFTVHFEPTKHVLKYQIDQPGHIKKIQNGINFMFSRDPFSRLWSAYLDKFFLPDFWFIGRIVIKELRLHISKTSRECGNDVTFEEVIRFIHNHRDDVRLNEHFTTVTYNCNPCKHQYDVIGKAETFNGDTDLVLANVGLLGEIAEDPDLDRVLEEINMLIDYNLDIQDNLVSRDGLPESCFDNLELSKKLWRVFQINGYIGEEIVFPTDILNDLNTRDDFRTKLKQLIADHRKGANKMELQSWKLQRTKLMQSAFNSLPDYVLRDFQNFYSIDFELFQYERHPSWLNKR